MRYQGRIFRPPSEADAYILQATIGCSWNHCTYCDMYRDKSFSLRPLEECLEDARGDGPTCEDQEAECHADEELPEEHLFVPREGGRGEDDGWIVGTSLDWRARVTRLNVFRADALADGPVARAALPLLLPAGLHGRFAPSRTA